MPIYIFAYTDDSGQYCEFDVNLTYEAMKATDIHSPCGTYKAKRVFSSFIVQHGRTQKQKLTGVTEKRLDMAKFAKAERDKRQKTAEPTSYAANSTEYWVNDSLPDGMKVKKPPK